MGIISQWHQTNFYIRKKRKENEQEFARIAKMDESLKETILAYIYSELNKNNSLESKNKKCKEIILSIDPSYVDSLGRIMHHKDFMQFNLSLVKENSDMRKAFSNMAVLLKVNKKTVGGDIDES